MAIPTTNIFLASIEKSGLLSADRLAEALDVAESAGAEADVKTVGSVGGPSQLDRRSPPRRRYRVPDVTDRLGPQILWI